MIHTVNATQRNLPKPILPRWAMDRTVPETLSAAGFLSGSALTLLHVALHDPTVNVPVDLLRSRLALRAAVHCNKIEGRAVMEAEVRDAFLLTAVGDAMGPNGDMLAFWRAGTGLNLRSTDWSNRLLALLSDEIGELFPDWLQQSDDLVASPVDKAVRILQAALQQCPRRESEALLCADAVLSRALGWERVVPLLSISVVRKLLRSASEGEDNLRHCHTALASAAQDAVRLVHDLGRRAARLHLAVPKLRTKVAADAVQLFLSEDAVLVSSMLTPTIRGSSTPMTPRSARRFCERLIELGVARELTNRPTFRLYGVA